MSTHQYNTYLEGIRESQKVLVEMLKELADEDIKRKPDNVWTVSELYWRLERLIDNYTGIYHE